MKKKHRLILIAASLLGVAVLTFLYFYDYHAERRFVLYNMMKEMKAEMPREEVESIIEKHSRPFVSKKASGKDIILCVTIGFTRYCFLIVNFRDGKLDAAAIRGEDGSFDYYEDAPKDIGWYQKDYHFQSVTF